MNQLELSTCTGIVNSIILSLRNITTEISSSSHVGLSQWVYEQDK